MVRKPFPPNYTAEEAIRMLPYIRGYCRDISLAYRRTRRYARLGHRLNSLATLSKPRGEKIERIKQRILELIERNKNNILRWYNELQEMHMVICETEHGAVDIPVMHFEDRVIYLCVLPDSTPENLHWHSLDEGYDKARPLHRLPITQAD